MSTITFLHPETSFERVCEIHQGQSILDVALANDVPLQHACGGFCACTTCHVQVHTGGECLSSIEEDEKERMETMAGRTERSRLGCQAKLAAQPVGKGIVVEIVNRDF